jgi:hypothetical protein
MGTPPTHPELLDWLATDFMENGWKIKRLHKMIMTSNVYRQSSSTGAAENQELAGQKTDPSNSLLWRMNLRRLEAEVVRDSVLDVPTTATSQWAVASAARNCLGRIHHGCRNARRGTAEK